MPQSIAKALRALGQPVLSYPLITSLLSSNASIFIAQLVYWTPRSKEERDGWIFKSSAEIESETGLSYKEQIKAREKLLAGGLMEERHDRKNHRMEFRLLDDGFEHLTDGHMPNGHVATDQSSGGTLPKVSCSGSDDMETLDLTHSKITSETTSKITDSDPNEVFKELKSIYRRETGKSLKSPGPKLLDWFAFLKKHGEEKSIEAFTLWVKETDRKWLRSIQWPFAAFMKQSEEWIQEREGQAEYEAKVEKEETTSYQKLSTAGRD